MLTVTVPGTEFFDEETETFIRSDEQTLRLEHSLASISKWESRHHKPFLGSELSYEETLDYISCMSEDEAAPFIVSALTGDTVRRINDYIEDTMTGTTFSNAPGKKGKREIITAEIIYYWMTALNIPLECEHWHLNRLMTLIRVCSIKNSPTKKMSKSEAARQARELNAARRKRLQTKG